MYVGSKINAKVSKRVTADGKFEVCDDCEVGHVFRIYPGTIQPHEWTNKLTGEKEMRMSVFMESDHDNGWFPIELLEVEWN